MSAPLAILTDSASFVVSVLGLLMIRTRESPPPREQGRLRGIWRRIGAGLGLLLRDPHLRPLAGEAATSNLFGTAIGTLLILYAVRDLGLSPALYGGIIALGSFGALFGALLAHWCSRRLRLGRALMVAYTLVCASPLLVPLAAGSMTVSIAVLASFELLSGIGLTMSNIYVITLRQTICRGAIWPRQRQLSLPRERRPSAGCAACRGAGQHARCAPDTRALRWRDAARVAVGLLFAAAPPARVAGVCVTTRRSCYAGHSGCTALILKSGSNPTTARSRRSAALRLGLENGSR